MSVPGFTADSAVYRTNGCYRTTVGGGFVGPRQVITPQDAFCELYECPQECSAVCDDEPGSTMCKRCLKDCRKSCYPDWDFDG